LPGIEIASDPDESESLLKWQNHFFPQVLLDRLLAEANVFYIEFQFV